MFRKLLITSTLFVAIVLSSRVGYSQFGGVQVQVGGYGTGVRVGNFGYGNGYYGGYGNGSSYYRNNSKALSSFSHSRKDDMNHTAEPKDIDFEHLADLRFIAFFYCGKVSDPRIIDQHIDATEMVFRRFHCCFRLRSVGHIQLKNQCVTILGKPSYIFSVACRDDDSIA